jgi:glycine/D-amino acid oxidase-like deaminating enzyme/nitrite reductase/ring-hydroxylating ferredoxin subunit
VHGRDHAQAVWDAGHAALAKVHSLVHKESIDCDFRWVPGYLHLPWTSDGSADMLREYAAAARDLGFEAEFLDRVPFAGRPGVRFNRQARFHPLKYIAGLLKRIVARGGHVFERTEAREFADEPRHVKANKNTIECEAFVIATHVPLTGVRGLVGAALFQTKLASYSSYVVSARVPVGTVPDALFWDTDTPYRYLRIAPGAKHDTVIFGGHDHKTGQEPEPQKRFEALEDELRAKVPNAAPDTSWTGQVVETHDGLPYIGESARGQFIATGYAGNGLTYGTLAGIMGADVLSGRRNPWTELFSPSRVKLASTWDYIKENSEYPYYFLKSRLASSEGASLAELPRDEGRILKLDGRRVAAHRDADGRVTLLNPTCPHLGCHVNWNAAGGTWDCPCHGSRFQPTGEVLTGPAESNLATIDPPGEAKVRTDGPANL